MTRLLDHADRLMYECEPCVAANPEQLSLLEGAESRKEAVAA
jgi:hypothetical protein